MGKSSKESHEATLSFDTRFLKKGKRSVVLLLPDTMHAGIGLVIAYWGHFEFIFDRCLEGLVEADAEINPGRETSAWKKNNFRSRRQLFRTLCLETLAPKFEDEAKKLILLDQRVGDLHWRRNMLAHGQYEYSLLPHSSKATNFRARNPRNNKVMPFTLDTIKKLHHQISHLSADLITIFSVFSKIEGDFHTFPDTELLEAYREWKTHHDPTTAHKP
jgi:hypothetical protein